jgi:hypothetical protein
MKHLYIITFFALFALFLACAIAGDKASAGDSVADWAQKLDGQTITILVGDDEWIFAGDTYTLKNEAVELYILATAIETRRARTFKMRNELDCKRHGDVYTVEYELFTLKFRVE